jgi:hypothetical protein
MNRRTILKAIGLAPLLPVASALIGKNVTKPTKAKRGGLTLEQVEEIGRATLADFPKSSDLFNRMNYAMVNTRFKSPNRQRQMLLWDGEYF